MNSSLQEGETTYTIKGVEKSEYYQTSKKGMSRNLIACFWLQIIENSDVTDLDNEINLSSHQARSSEVGLHNSMARQCHQRPSFFPFLCLTILEGFLHGYQMEVSSITVQKNL